MEKDNYCKGTENYFGFCNFALPVSDAYIQKQYKKKHIIYIASGEAEDYREQMNLQTGLMECKEINDIVVPFINDVQGPLMQMPVTENPTAWSNQVTARFYGKNSVVAIERSQWEELYTR